MIWNTFFLLLFVTFILIWNQSNHTFVKHITKIKYSTFHYCFVHWSRNLIWYRLKPMVLTIRMNLIVSKMNLWIDGLLSVTMVVQKRSQNKWPLELETGKSENCTAGGPIKVNSRKWCRTKFNRWRKIANTSHWRHKSVCMLEAS